MKNSIVSFLRRGMTRIATVLNRWTNGKLKPSHITTLSIIGHIPVAWALVTCQPILAAVLLAFFSALDALDGALARVQKSSSLSGMYYDAVSDRLKEIIVFSALAVYASKHIDTNISWLIVAVAGTSLLVSYTKSKGEMALSGKEKDAQKLNKIFSAGIASYEIRVVLLVIGLLFGWLIYILPLLLLLNCITILTRFMKVIKELKIIDRKESGKK
jgi:CDP-diacylglycerol--glycerol-3-phosphate 3-phosphatidyltransferase